MSTNLYEDAPVRGTSALDTTTIPSAGSHIHRRISWGAILGGVVLVVAVQLLLSMLGAGIGLGTVDTTAGATPDAGTLGVSGGIWWLVSGMIALCFGGFVSAWLAGIEIRWDGILHGLVTWGIATLLTVYLLSAAIGGIVGGGLHMLGNVTAAAGTGIKDAAQPAAQAAGVTPDVLQQQAKAYLRPADPDPATMSPQDAQKEIVADLATYAKGGPEAPAAKERVIDIMAAQQKISHDDAARQFDATEAKFQQDKAKAIQAAKAAADATAAAASKTLIATFGNFLLGAIAAAIGGALAVQRRLLVSRRFVA